MMGGPYMFSFDVEEEKCSSKNEVVNDSFELPLYTTGLCYGQEGIRGLHLVAPSHNEIKRLTKKQKLKQKVKKENKKYIIGEIYKLRAKSIFNIKENLYICKKIIYTIKETPVEIVIMKSLNERINTNIFTLTKNDCKKFHIKYESGLEVFSMKENFLKVKQNVNSCTSRKK